MEKLYTVLINAPEWRKELLDKTCSKQEVQDDTTYDEDILKEFQATCEEYGMKANVVLVLEALMKFFRREIVKS